MTSSDTWERKTGRFPFFSDVHNISFINIIQIGIIRRRLNRNFSENDTRQTYNTHYSSVFLTISTHDSGAASFVICMHAMSVAWPLTFRDETVGCVLKCFNINDQISLITSSPSGWKVDDIGLTVEKISHQAANNVSRIKKVQMLRYL